MKNKLKYILLGIIFLTCLIIIYFIYNYNDNGDKNKPKLSNDGDCCSCCPNLKEGEVCIDVCCSCE